MRLWDSPSGSSECGFWWPWLSLPLLTWQSPPLWVGVPYGLPWWLSRQRFHLQCRKHGFNAWVRKIPWRRKRQPTPVFLPGESHGQRRLVGYSPWGCRESDNNWSDLACSWWWGKFSSEKLHILPSIVTVSESSGLYVLLYSNSGRCLLSHRCNHD